jgi:hypothetical protein
VDLYTHFPILLHGVVLSQAQDKSTWRGNFVKRKDFTFTLYFNVVSRSWFAKF